MLPSQAVDPPAMLIAVVTVSFGIVSWNRKGTAPQSNRGKDKTRGKYEVDL